MRGKDPQQKSMSAKKKRKMAVIAERSGTRERHEDIFAAFKSTECLFERARAQKSAEDGRDREAIRDA